MYIPSRSRADKITKGMSSTIPWLSAAGIRSVLVVPKSQVKEYSRVVDSAGVASSVVACPKDGIAKTRHWIGQYAAKNGESSFIMMDDDIRFYIRKSATDVHLRDQNPKELSSMVSALHGYLVSGKYGACGVSPREGNNRLDFVKVVENTRLIRVLGFDTEEFLKCKHGRVAVMEDFDILLQLLRRGLPNVMTVNYAQGQMQTQSAGGCSDYRTHELHEESAKRLAEIHAPFVTLRQKVNKSGGAFGTRTEVTIYWKRAYESSKV